MARMVQVVQPGGIPDLQNQQRSPYDMGIGMGLEPQPNNAKPLDFAEGLGTGINEGYGTNPYLPKPAAFAGELLKSFGETRASQRGLERRRSLEGRLGVPMDFFLRLSKDAQDQILSRSGLGGDSYMDQPLPELEGGTYRQAMKGGLETHAGLHTIPLDLLPKDQVLGYLSQSFPGLAGLAQDPLAAARTENLKQQTGERQQRAPAELLKLLAQVGHELASGRAADALTTYRNYRTGEAKKLSESNQVPDIVLAAARNQGFSQFKPGTPVTWKEYRAVTRNNAALNAFSEAIVQSTGRLLELSDSGTKVTDAMVDQVANDVGKSLKGTISDDSIKQLRQAIKDQWRMSQGLVSGGSTNPLGYDQPGDTGGGLDDEGQDGGELFP